MELLLLSADSLIDLELFRTASLLSRFRLGFPYGWEKYGVLGYGEQSATGDVTRRKSGCAGYESSSTGKDTDLAVPLDDLPVTRIRDSLMFAPGGSEGCGLDEILRSFCRQHTEDTSVSSCSSVEKKSAVTTVNHSINQTPRRKKKMSKAEMKGEGGNEIEKCVGTSSRGVTTRSMSRLGNLRKLEDLHSNSHALSKSVPRKKPDRKLSSNSATITDNGAQLSTPEEVARNDQKVIPAAVSSEEATDYFPYRSPCKRSSSRLKTCKS